jgi:hypothetical protein
VVIIRCGRQDDEHEHQAMRTAKACHCYPDERKHGEPLQSTNVS